MKRQALFAAQGWYPDEAAITRHELERYVTSDAPPSKALALIAPHAGWVYSGATAGSVYAEVDVPDRVVVLCPMHRAGGPRVGIWPEGEWETPLGNMPVDSDFAAALLNKHKSFEVDLDGHRMEHAIEIHLPFIKFRNENARIVPIRLGHLGWPDIQEVGEALAKTIKESDGDTLIVASTDMSHEDDYDRAKTNDALAKEALLNLDALGLLDTVDANRITMCGVIPVAVTIEATRLLGAKNATQIAYTTSADVSGRRDYVVGYLAARIDG